MKKHVRDLCLLCTLILSMLCGCMAPPRVLIKDGREYCKVDGHFTYRWYDYYERAVSCSDGEFYEEALSDLDKAIDQRDEDVRMAKVWGMRLRDYFPHREKGIIHYIQGQDEAAQSELERSVREEPSAKAKTWLDKVRKRLMEQEPPSVPLIFISGLSDGNEIWTRDKPVLLSGWAEDEQYVSEITINGQPYLVERSGKRVDFGRKLNLSQGEHRIRITATNLRGARSAEREIVIHVDRSGPVIILEETDLAASVLRGYAYDESGEIHLFANGKEVGDPKAGKVAFSLPLTDSIRLVARDRLGNQTEAEIPPGPPLKKGGEMLSLQEGRYFPISQSEKFTSPLMAWNKFSGISSDSCGFSIATHSQSSDPSLRISLDELPNVIFSETVSLRGMVSGEGDIREVLINGIPLHNGPGQAIFFNHTVLLNKGENTITIRARGEETESVRNISVTRETPEILKPEYRCMFNTHPFETVAFSDMGNVSAGNSFQPIFLDSLTEKKRFQVRIADGMRSRFMLQGHVYATRHGLEVVAEVTDVETSQILGSEDARGVWLDIYTESDERSTLASVAGDLSEKFHRAFPLVSGRIAEKLGENLFRAKMEGGQIRLEWPLLVGSGTRFIANADIDEQRGDGVCLIRLANLKGSEPLAGYLVVGE